MGRFTGRNTPRLVTYVMDALPSFGLAEGHCLMAIVPIPESDSMTRRIHPLKTWPNFFELIESGVKTFELRKNDRNYRAGDILFLQEWDPSGEEAVSGE